MKIGISRISQTRDEAYEVLDAARRYGFKGVQLKPSQYEEFLNCPAAFTEQYGELANLACGGLIVYPGNDPTMWFEKLEGVLRFASGVKANHVCLCSDVYATDASEAEVRAVADALTHIGKSASQQGVMISIHNHVNSLVETEEDIARLLSLLDPALCGLTLDTAHAAKAGIANVSRLASRFQNHLLNVHLKDLDADGNFCALGQGILELDPIVQTLESIKYNQWLIIDEETGAMKTEAAFGIAAEYLTQRYSALIA
jgi:sugar phosphate isomerase/epimerase